ncbi:DksA/TraR family C4-type zinc finger protein [Shewanella fodinae]|uniref:TraR/DksA family transcriptional regulator n=1 Tax=Shewanella fodinae TaxID=552357 RepID=A0A4R2FH85_9GAMM|nr:DksA/TraR family C4-type zinc finger protein [Shewanella fodinae]TCN87039.1 TraR/DksA family transcriptional regulator [Shewanella fodinae]
MASGWAQDGADLQQIESTVEDGVNRVRQGLPQGESLTECEECGETIPEARRVAIPGVRLCVNCQALEDKRRQSFAGYNRRGSKDSQLR